MVVERNQEKSGDRERMTTTLFSFFFSVIIPKSVHFYTTFYLLVFNINNLTIFIINKWLGVAYIISILNRTL